MIFAPLLGIRLGLDQLAMLIGLMLLLAVVLTSLGVLIAARQKTMEGFHTIINFVMLPMFFLSGAFFPLTGVPLWMDLLSKINPVTYGVDPLRQVALQGSLPAQFMDLVRLYPLATDVAVILAFCVLFLVPAILLFGRRD
jgi:ABC-2 type transport system permease protein